MSGAEHTPLPWKLWGPDICGPDCDDGDDLVLGCIGRSAGFRSHQYGLVKAHKPEAKANGEFIIRACNSHYDLLEALSSLLAVAEMTTFSDQYPAECEAARAAIARATGEQV